jgi:hypothetical protein
MMTIKQPSYIDTGKEPASDRPSFIAAMNGREDGRPKPKLKTFAEQTKAMSPRDAHNLDGHRGDLDLPTDIHTEAKDREIQPPGFQPMPFLQQRVKAFLESPAFKNGYRVYSRVKFETVDIPMVNISDAFEDKFAPVILLGKEKEKSTTRLFLKFGAPGPDTVLEALEKILTALSEWDAGQGYGKNGKYHPSLYIYGAYDYPEEVIAVIA